MYSVFEKLCKERNVRPYEVSRATGIASSTFTSWKKGEYEPKKEKMEKMHRTFESLCIVRNLACLLDFMHPYAPVFRLGSTAESTAHSTTNRMGARMRRGVSLCHSPIRAPKESCIKSPKAIDLIYITVTCKAVHTFINNIVPRSSVRSRFRVA